MNRIRLPPSLGGCEIGDLNSSLGGNARGGVLDGDSPDAVRVIQRQVEDVHGIAADSNRYPIILRPLPTIGIGHLHTHHMAVGLSSKAGRLAPRTQQYG